MVFRDRKDAGYTLSLALEKYRGKDVLILAIPKGGIEVGVQVARHLGSEFSIVVLETPVNFQAVALVYRHWTDVTDREAVKLLEAWRAADDAPETAYNFE